MLGLYCSVTSATENGAATRIGVCLILLVAVPTLLSLLRQEEARSFWLAYYEHGVNALGSVALCCFGWSEPLPSLTNVVAVLAGAASMIVTAAVLWRLALARLARDGGL
jgi:hypothetical protein